MKLYVADGEKDWREFMQHADVKWNTDCVMIIEEISDVEVLKF